MEEGGFVSGDADAKDTDVVVFEDEVVVGFLGNGDGGGGLRVQGKCQKQQRGAE
jgi:hypothetical protein